MMLNEGYSLLESIKVDKNRIYNLSYHEERIARSSMELFGQEIKMDFEPLIDEVFQLPDILYKLRIVYNANFFKYDFIPYKLPSIKSLKLVQSNNISYTFKLSDRSLLSNLYKRKQHHDDILIVKNGLFTDSYYCNLAFKQSGVWYTPSTPLLRGTKRQVLLDQKRLVEKLIPLSELSQYNTICLFNAMIDLEQVTLPVSHIF